MPWNGTGSFSRVHDWENDAAANIPIDPTRHDQEADSFADGINQALAKDGQNTPTANLPMAGFKHTNVGTASARNEYAQVGQVQDGAFGFAVSTGSGSAYTVNLFPAVITLGVGQEFRFQANHTNSGATTLAISATGSKPVVLDDGTTALTGGEIVLGRMYSVIYDGTSFRLTAINASAFGRSLIDDSDAAAGRVTLALGTAAVKNTGTSGDAVPVLNGAASTWSSSITVQLTGLGDGLIARSTDAGATGGPNVVIDRDSATPAASDFLGSLVLRGNNSNGDTFIYGSIGCMITDPTQGAEAGVVRIRSSVAGVDDFVSCLFGAGIYGSTGGLTDPGQSKINMADVQINGLSVAWTYTAQTATTSGTTVVLTTAIPAGATEIEILFFGVSTNTANQPPLVQFGDAGGYETSGYLGGASHMVGGAITTTVVTDGFTLDVPGSFAAANNISAVMRLHRWDTAEHRWHLTGSGDDGATIQYVYSGNKETSQALTSIRLNTTGGAATFDAGEARVRYR